MEALRRRASVVEADVFQHQPEAVVPDYDPLFQQRRNGRGCEAALNDRMQVHVVRLVADRRNVRVRWSERRFDAGGLRDARRKVGLDGGGRVAIEGERIGDADAQAGKQRLANRGRFTSSAAGASRK
jgi:hypothetical protein